MVFGIHLPILKNVCSTSKFEVFIYFLSKNIQDIFQVYERILRILHITLNLSKKDMDFAFCTLNN